MREKHGRAEGEKGMEERELYPYLFSMVQEDHCAIVLCNLHHEIVYMNPAARERYAKSGGRALVGKSLMDCHGEKSRERIEKVLDWFRAKEENNRMYTSYNEKENKDVYMIALRNLEGRLIGYYEKHEYRDRETMDLYDFGE